MLRVTRSYGFSASHRLFNSELSEEENLKVYGVCCNENGHGHNYRLEVSILGEPEGKTGYVLAPREMDHLIEETLISQIDHKNLNVDVSFLKNSIPTLENMLPAFWAKLEAAFPAGVSLVHLRLYETENNFADFSGGTDV